ncbi:flavodoxin family protein [bacterium]|nr:flavodoxin family protein [bacterium]
MKILTISGSRNPDGKTATMTEALLKGAEKKGAQIRRHFLPSEHVESCRQCDERGWGDCLAKGSCVIADDFAGIVDEIRDSDAVVFASPVYFGDLSESLRAFTDRLRRILRHESAKPGIEGKPAIGVCVAGGGGGGAPNCIVSLEKVLRTCGFDLVDVIPVRRQNMDLKGPVLEMTGEWFAGRGKQS